MASVDTHSLLTERPLLRCEHQYGALIWLQCESAFPTSRIGFHFTRHHHYPPKIYRKILQPFDRHWHSLAENWDDLWYSEEWMVPIEELKVRAGYACMECGARTTNKATARKYYSKCAGDVVQAHLQCWNKTGALKYWTVIVPGGLTSRTATNVVSDGILMACVEYLV